MEQEEWLEKCLKCAHCYTVRKEDEEYRCRLRKGRCEFKEYKSKKKRKDEA